MTNPLDFAARSAEHRSQRAEKIIAVLSAARSLFASAPYRRTAHEWAIEQAAAGDAGLAGDALAAFYRTTTEPTAADDYAVEAFDAALAALAATEDLIRRQKANKVRLEWPNGYVVEYGFQDFLEANQDDDAVSAALLIAEAGQRAPVGGGAGPIVFLSIVRG